MKRLRQHFNTNRNLFIIALIIMVNMLGYGIVIPLIYGYSKKFGLSDFQNGLLFALYSICQFFSTPIIGRLSDKFGRKPLLLVSIMGTAGSFLLMAFAPNAIWLFLARALDGLTAGNIPVAFAVISDSTEPKDRARAFGVLGAAFSFGFIFGPALAAFTVNFGEAIPFLIAAAVTIVATILAWLYLPETNQHMGEVKKGKIIDLHLLWKTLFDPNVGVTFMVSLIYFLAFSCAIIYGFQPFTMNVLHITQSQNAQLFTVFGVVGLISQTFLVSRISKMFGMKRAFSLSLLGMAMVFVAMFVMGILLGSQAIWLFIATTMFLGLANSVISTLLPAILSQEADAKSQGTIMGLNTSYQSVGMTVGPLLGGAVATLAVSAPFLVGGLLALGCFGLSFRMLRPGVHKESAF